MCVHKGSRPGAEVPLAVPRLTLSMCGTGPLNRIELDNKRNQLIPLSVDAEKHYFSRGTCDAVGYGKDYHIIFKHDSTLASPTFSLPNLQSATPLLQLQRNPCHCEIL